ncbi:TetR/AcrR family transcriptional regulator C-terminal domain-containing protein [Actinoallomurus purpureus]|uniref:TetR/AcrR family transcriptional regulator C-terminal domain-containing protein n=1 Tax=Actinoallomurus purpureus TaxID=478114 RepID=UPI00355760BE
MTSSTALLHTGDSSPGLTDPERLERILTGLLARYRAAGLLAIPDPAVAAGHFVALRHRI